MDQHTPVPPHPASHSLPRPGRIRVRPATERDQQAIKALVRSERLNPTGLVWTNFIVATDNGILLGAVQLRKHRDGSRELGSLVVSRPARGQGIAARLIDALLSMEQGRLHMITGAAFALHYRRWGFQLVLPHAAPASVRRNYRIGQVMGAVRRFLRRPNTRLAILERPRHPALGTAG